MFLIQSSFVCVFWFLRETSCFHQHLFGCSHAAVHCGVMLPEQLAAECLAQDHRGGNIESVGLKLVTVDVELSSGLYNKIIRNQL